MVSTRLPGSSQKARQGRTMEGKDRAATASGNSEFWVKIRHKEPPVHGGDMKLEPSRVVSFLGECLAPRDESPCCL